MDTGTGRFKVVPSILRLETLILEKDVGSLHLKKCKNNLFYVEVVTKDNDIVRTQCFEEPVAKNIYMLLATLLVWKKNIRYERQEYSG